MQALNLETSDGFRIFFVENNLQLISPYVFLEQETWFEPEIPFVRAFLKPGMRVIDVGANIGYYTLLSAMLVGAGGHVTAFEPGRIPARLLRESVKANGFDNVSVIEQAVGAVRGTIRFSDHSSSELSKIAAPTDVDTREVALESLDALHAEGTLGIVDFIKIDAEGFEADVIRGADRFFREQNPVVMIEVSEQPVKPPMMLEGLGYQQYRYCHGTSCLVPYIPGKVGDRVLNLLMCKPARAEQLARDGLLVTWEQAKANPPPADPSLFLNLFRSLAVTQACPEVAALADAPGLKPDWHQAMSEFVLSEDASQPLAQRAIRLKRAATFVDSNYSEAATIAELLTYCRVWLAAGRIYLVAGTLRAVILNPQHPPFQNLGSAFLPVGREWDGIAPADGNVAVWLKAMIMKLYENNHAFSSYYDGGMSIEIYRFLRQAKLADAWFERRAVLRGFRAGDTNYPAPTYIGEATRNREIWQEIIQRMKNETQIVALRHCVELSEDS